MLILVCEIGFDHVACLLEGHLLALLHGSDQVHMPSTELLQDPIRFLEVIHLRKVTITFAPNFFIAMVVRACKNSDKDWHVDLSSLRHVVSGGEANVTTLAAEVTRSVEELGGSGNGVLRAAFGMTEVSSGFDGCRYDHTDQGRLAPHAPTTSIALHMSCSATYNSVLWDRLSNL